MKLLIGFSIIILFPNFYVQMFSSATFPIKLHLMFLVLPETKFLKGVTNEIIANAKPLRF